MGSDLPFTAKSFSGPGTAQASPVVRGRIGDLARLEDVCRSAFEQDLGTDPAGSRVLLSEQLTNTEEVRESVTTLMFEKLDVGALFLISSASLAARASGHITGLVVNVDADSTSTVAVHEALPLSTTQKTADVAGTDPDANLKTIADLAMSTYRASPDEVRPGLLTSIVLVGQHTMVDGLPGRLTDLIRAQAPGHAVEVHAAPERATQVWTGGSITASTTSFEEMWFTREEYDDHGPNLIHQKCMW
ncbi:hypothetical protein ACFUT3_31565 [Streptomyces cinereoruber]|uniref:hypothetical protein n=1 Tax=Streptomyces cinereoruber TaxID=67260 RepID=UPI00363C9F8A